MNSSKTTAKHSTSNGLASPDSTSFAAGSLPQHNNESSNETDGSSSSSSCCEQILVKNCELGNDVAVHLLTDSDLCEMEMFVQGSSDSVCVLLMEKGSLSDVTALKKIVRFLFTLRIVSYSTDPLHKLRQVYCIILWPFWLLLFFPIFIPLMCVLLVFWK